MTLPYERKWAIANTELFLKALLNPNITPRIPKSIRDEARRCLKHYPSEYYMELAAEQAPEIFGKPKET